jgi:hypothetical protein
MDLWTCACGQVMEPCLWTSGHVSVAQLDQYLWTCGHMSVDLMVALCLWNFRAMPMACGHVSEDFFVNRALGSEDICL